MTYNIFSSTAPTMAKSSKGTEIVKLFLSKASKDMRKSLVLIEIPALAAHLSEIYLMTRRNKISIFDEVVPIFGKVVPIFGKVVPIFGKAVPVCDKAVATKKS